MKNVTIYSKDYCPYCRAAIQTLKKLNVKFEVIDVEFDAKQHQQMIQRSGRTTVPQIFFGDQHIGGYDDLMQYLSSQKAAS